MTLPALAIILLGICVSCGPQPIPVAVNHYIVAQEALAADDLEIAQAALKQLVRSGNESVSSLAEKASSLSSISQVRRIFKTLSENMINNYVIPVYFPVAYCPTYNKGAKWIQKNNVSIANPYYGTSMIECGVFKN